MTGLSMGRLRYLHEAVRTGGIRAAADALDVAPSAVSRQLAALEKAARMPLLETNRRGARPTLAGRILLEHYREHLAREEAVVSKLRDLEGLVHGDVAIGAIQGFADDLMRHALLEFNAHHPKIKLALRLGSVDDILNWLDEDEVHLGLTYGPGLDLRDARLKENAAAVQPLCVIAAPDHPVLRLPRIGVEDLLGYPFALASPDYGSRKIVDLIERESHRHFNVVLETDHLVGLTSFVRAGMGLTLLPAFAVHDELQSGALAARDVDHVLMREVRAQLVTRRGRELPISAVRLQRLLVTKLLAFR